MSRDYKFFPKKSKDSLKKQKKKKRKTSQENQDKSSAAIQSLLQANLSYKTIHNQNFIFHHTFKIN